MENCLDSQEVELKGDKYVVYLKEVPVKSRSSAQINSAIKAFVRKI